MTIIVDDITLGSEEERGRLTDLIAKIRAIGEQEAAAKFDKYRLCHELDVSGLWRLYGTWTLPRVLKEKCGVSVAGYQVYRSAVEHMTFDEAVFMGFPALEAVARLVQTVEDTVRQTTAETLYLVVSKRIKDYRVTYGHAPSARTAKATVRAEAIRIGIDMSTGKRNSAAERLRFAVATLEQIESLTGDTEAVGVLARNCLRVLGVRPNRSQSRPQGAEKTSASATAV